MERKCVVIELRTVIEYDRKKEMSIIKQRGTYIRKQATEIITFTEKRDDIGNIRNFITIQPKRVSIKRSGAVSMNQQFQVGKKSESLYRHPYGSIHFLMKTKSLRRTLLSPFEKGEIVITYEALINGIEKQRHHLTLTFTEEN